MVTHRILDPSPLATEVLAGQVQNAIADFMAFCFQGGIPMDWNIHFPFIDWLETNYPVPASRIPALRLESMAAAASAWAHAPYVDMNDSHLVIVDGTSRQICGATRANRFRDAVRVHRLQGRLGRLADPFPEVGFAYASGSSWSLERLRFP